MGGYKKKGRGKGKGRGRGGCSDSSSSSDSSADAVLDDATCRAMGFDGYDEATGECANFIASA